MTRLVQKAAGFLCVLLAPDSSAPPQPKTPTPTPAAAPPASDIFVVEVGTKRNRETKDLEPNFSEPKKITDYTGYNNQPFFLPDGHKILYTSIRNGQADIYQYDLKSGKTTQVTSTPESEYST